MIGFEQTEYEVLESRVSYEFVLGVVTGALAQNITLTIVPTPITAGRLLINPRLCTARVVVCVCVCVSV